MPDEFFYFTSDGAVNTVSERSGPIQNSWFIVNGKDKVIKKPNETVTVIG